MDFTGLKKIIRANRIGYIDVNYKVTKQNLQNYYIQLVNIKIVIDSEINKKKDKSTFQKYHKWREQDV